jgi:hypothetical protein
MRSEAQVPAGFGSVCTRLRNSRVKAKSFHGMLTRIFHTVSANAPPPTTGSSNLGLPDQHPLGLQIPDSMGGARFLSYEFSAGWTAKPRSKRQDARHQLAAQGACMVSCAWRGHRALQSLRGAVLPEPGCRYTVAGVKHRGLGPGCRCAVAGVRHPGSGVVSLE